MITVYTRNNCTKCQQVKNYMDSAKIEYEVENIEDNQQALKLARQVGGMGFPFVVFSPTDYIAGNTEKIIEKLMLKIPEVEKVEELFFWGK